MDELLKDLFGVSYEISLEFFHNGLQEVTGDRPNEQMNYVASILANFSMYPRFSHGGAPLADLGEVFDNFVYRSEIHNNAEIFELAGSQIILFAGFFRRQMNKRHNVEWYDNLGKSFFIKASINTLSPKKRNLFESVGQNLPYWNKTCAILNQKCRENKYVI